MNKVYLASASPRRRELLQQIGIPYEIMPASGDESTDLLLPDQIVLELSRRKAEEICRQVQKREGSFTIIGADTVVAFEGKVMGKPVDEADACAMLRSLSGNVHQVYTGVTLCSRRGEQQPIDTVSFYECTNVVLYSLTEEEIKAYVSTGEPMDKAGAYAIQGGFAAYVKSIEGDFYNVVGLPAGRLYQELKKIAERHGYFG